MEIKDILDRFEILFNSVELQDLRRSYTDRDLSSIFRLFNKTDALHTVNVEDLRKAVTEQNLHSIFRLVDEVVNEVGTTGIEDLRKAVTEQNLHSIFRLVDADDLRKLLLDDNMWSLWKLLQDATNSQFVYALKYLHTNNIPFDEDCFSRGQLKSKLWLVDKIISLDIDLGTVFVCAGWYSTLSALMFESGVKIDKVVSFDVDPTCASIAEIFNKPWVIDGWKFKASTKNIMDINYMQAEYKVTRADGTTCDAIDKPTTIINTSCEHIANFSQWYDLIPAGNIVILQTNNYKEVEDHVNCSNSLGEFCLAAPMREVLYEGELELEKYTRFTIIGIK